jgi:hypothetical protein
MCCFVCSCGFGNKAERAYDISIFNTVTYTNAQRRTNANLLLHMHLQTHRCVVGRFVGLACHGATRSQHRHFQQQRHTYTHTFMHNGGGGSESGDVAVETSTLLALVNNRGILTHTLSCITNLLLL